MTQPPPAAQIMQMLSGYWLTQGLYVAAKLELADRLASGPRHADELAAETGCQPRALYRLLRSLASLGVFTEIEPRTFALTPLAECLRRDVPGSQWAAAIMSGEHQYGAFGELIHSVRTGESAYTKVEGKPLFDHLAENPEKAAVFDMAMTGIHGRESPAMIAAYDFSQFNVLVDVGGGNGTLLTAILTACPSLHGVLFDLPNVAERAAANLRDAGLADRCKTVGGSFFELLPGDGDAYLFRHIIHDWDDEQSIRILRNCHEAMPAHARLLVVESVIPAGNQPHFAKLLDLAMLALPGGIERTEDEYRELFETCGFHLSRIVPTTADVSIIEGVKQP